MRRRFPLALLLLLLSRLARAAESSTINLFNNPAAVLSEVASKASAAKAGDSAETTSAPLPTLPPTKTTTPASNEVPQGVGVGMHGIMATVNSTGTNPATAPWATKTSGGMAAFSDDLTTIVVHTDSSIEYGCPLAGDSWQQESLTDSLTAHTATGKGCYMKYTFTGDSVQVYGATGVQAGVFGCSIGTSLWNATGWWNAYGSGNHFQPYAGSCQMQGLGYDSHEIQLVNSPNEPKKLYFTGAPAVLVAKPSRPSQPSPSLAGLRFTTNKTQTVWETHSWSACCAGYTFPQGVGTIVSVAPSATGSSGSSVGGLSTGTFGFVIVGVAAAIILASVLVGSVFLSPCLRNS
ncbi:hypothetical protein AAT19DRAFT_9264 [Rhodotorula toruloides]|uniref:Uncharacterized protein n=1 Tax=Rhodotorula toruloides TaxID=5286 RepID=A0A2T0AJN3_RHOTO|nr:hypothetical protein AAT19DRAFT_9264 [Rhodotorula toruloides]